MNAKLRTRLLKRAKLSKGELPSGNEYYFTRKPMGLKSAKSGSKTVQTTPTRAVREKAKANESTLKMRKAR